MAYCITISTFIFNTLFHVFVNVNERSPTPQKIWEAIERKLFVFFFQVIVLTSVCGSVCTNVSNTVYFLCLKHTYVLSI